jgi:hypothetical protein
MSKDLVHLVDGGQPVAAIDVIMATANEGQGAQSQSPFIRIAAEQQSPRFEFTEKSNRSHGTNEHSPRGFGGSSEGLTQRAPGSTVTGMGPLNSRFGVAPFGQTPGNNTLNTGADLNDPNYTQRSPG